MLNTIFHQYDQLVKHSALIAFQSLIYLQDLITLYRFSKDKLIVILPFALKIRTHVGWLKDSIVPNFFELLHILSAGFFQIVNNSLPSHQQRAYQALNGLWDEVLFFNLNLSDRKDTLNIHYHCMCMTASTSLNHKAGK